MCFFTTLICHVIDGTTSSFTNQHSDDLQKKKRLANEEVTQRFMKKTPHDKKLKFYTELILWPVNKVLTSHPQWTQTDL